MRFGPILGSADGAITVYFTATISGWAFNGRLTHLDREHRAAFQAFEEVLQRPSQASTVLLRPGGVPAAEQPAHAARSNSARSRGQYPASEASQGPPRTPATRLRQCVGDTSQMGNVHDRTRFTGWK